jgi:hypothetical protein
MRSVVAHWTPATTGEQESFVALETGEAPAIMNGR